MRPTKFGVGQSVLRVEDARLFEEAGDPGLMLLEGGKCGLPRLRLLSDLTGSK